MNRMRRLRETLRLRGGERGERQGGKPVEIFGCNGVLDARGRNGGGMGFEIGREELIEGVGHADKAGPLLSIVR